MRVHFQLLVHSDLHSCSPVFVCGTTLMRCSQGRAVRLNVAGSRMYLSWKELSRDAMPWRRSVLHGKGAFL